MRRRKIILLTLVLPLLLVTAWYGFSRLHHTLQPIQITTTKAEKATVAKNRIRVAAYNIAHGRGGKLGASNWENEESADLLSRLDLIAEQIKSIDADVVVLNEADFNANWSFGIDQAHYLAEKCGFPYLLQQRNYGVSLPFFSLHFGNALLSKYPIANVEHLRFKAFSTSESIFAGNHNGFICDIELPGHPLTLVGVHLEYRDETTRVLAARTLHQAAKMRGNAFIALGDFNSSPDSGLTNEHGDNAIQYLLEAGYVASMPNAPSNFTFPSEKPERKIDWIFGSRIEGFANAEVVPSTLSDHLMIVTDVLLNPISEQE